MTLYSRFVALVCLLVAFGWNCRAADLLIDAVELKSDARVEIRFTPSPSSYYRLFRGRELRSIRDLVQVSLTSPMVTVATEDQGFFQLEQISRAAGLDSDADGLPDLYELGRPSFQPLNPADARLDFDRDGIPNVEEFQNGTDPEVGELRPTTVTASPAQGDDGVSVHRETVLSFSRPLSVGATLDNATLRADSLGRAILVRRAISPDRRRATLFYLEPLPSGSRVRVTLDGARLLDDRGIAVDGDADGQAGGVMVVEFDTAPSSAVPETAVIGRVFASELRPGTDTGINAVNRPLAGVIVTVDGQEESLRTVTDADGNFTLKPSPAGRFFVKVDGRTAVGSDWPSGNYYPIVGKAWEAVAGRLDNLAGGNGQIFLPRIAAGTLQVVKTSGNTVVSFPDDVLRANPALAGVSLLIPPGSLSDDAGLRGGRIGIAPVPPDRLPEPLPDDLQFPLVITVQSDGPQNLSIPAPICFPNLPDPETGLVAVGGSKSALWSFDHDKGYWEIVGSMTVSPDGSRVCTDPGVGIQQPGWHGVQPGASGSGGEVEKEEEQCSVLIVGPIGGTTNVVYSFGTSISGGGSWSWSAPGGEPSAGSGPEFSTRYAQLGDYQITVAYTSPDGEQECSDVHTVRITPDECRVSIGGFVRAVAGVRETYQATVHPEVGTYRWSVDSGGSLFGQGDGPTVDVAWRTGGRHVLKLVYTTKPPSGAPQTCEDEVSVFVDETLELLDHRDLPLSDAEPPFVGSTITVHGNLSSSLGRYEWSGSEGVNILNPASSHTQISFSSPGMKVIQATFTPFEESGKSQTRLVTLRVRDTCTVVLTPLRSVAAVGDPVTVTVTTAPDSGGTVSWEAVGATPATGTGRSFTTRYAKEGIYQVTATYETAQGERCSVLGSVQVGAIDCRLTLSGPSVLEPGEVGDFSVLGNGTSGFYAAKVATTGESLGFGQPGDGVPFEFGVGFNSPGTYTVEVVYLGTFALLTPGECTLTHTVTVSGPTPPVPSLADVSGAGSPAVRPVKGRNYYARVNLKTGSIRRGLTAANGVAHPRPVRVASLTRFREYLLNERTLKVAIETFESPADGVPFGFPRFLLQPDLSPDGDRDGLSDLAEFIVGTDPTRSDTDGDGVNDGTEVRSGTQPLGEDPGEPGALGGAATSGYAWDVCVEGDRALLAAGAAGLEVFNVFETMPPVRIAQLKLGGEATAVACLGRNAIVAVRGAGLAMVDLEGPSAPSLRALTPTGAEVSGVAMSGGLAAAALEDGSLLLLDSATGTVIQKLELGYPLDDVLVSGRYVYVLGRSGEDALVSAVEVRDGFAFVSGSASSKGSRGAGGRRLRLVSGSDRLLVIHTAGFSIIDLTNPGQPSVEAQVLTGQFGWRHAAMLGENLFAAADPVSTDDGAHDVQIYRFEPGGTTVSFDQQIPTPGSAEAVAIRQGLGYVADGASGLQVVRFQDADRAGRPPLVSWASPPVESRVEEAKMFVQAVLATDDVGVSRVEFLLDGTLVATDASPPFELKLLTPRRALGREIIRLRARAIDTGGNVTVSDELALELTADASAPVAMSLTPPPGVEVANEAVRSIQVVFNEPIEASSLPAGSLRLFFAGSDATLGTADDVDLPGEVTYSAATSTLILSLTSPVAQGRFRAVLLEGLGDRVGNRLTSPVSWDFTVVGPRVVQRLPAPGGNSGGTRVEIRFSSFLDPASVGAAPVVTSAGPDEQLGTGDDVLMGGSVNYLPGTAELARHFAAPLPSGNYRVLLPQTLASAAQVAMAAPVTWDFKVSSVTFGTNAISLSGVLAGEFATDEHRVTVQAGGAFVIQNPNQLRVVLTRLDGSILADENRSLLKISDLVPGAYLIQVHRGAGGGSLNYTLGLNRFSQRVVEQVLVGESPQSITGRTKLDAGDEDVYLLSMTAGQNYFVQLLASGFPCPVRWSVFEPGGVPLVFLQAGCGQSAVVRSPTGGVMRVVVEGLRAGRADLRVTRSQQRSFQIDLTGVDLYSSSSDPQFSGSKSTLNPGDSALVAITAAAGEEYHFSDPSGSFECMSVRFTGPTGEILTDEECDGPRTLTFGAGGVHQLRIVNTLSGARSMRLLLARHVRRMLPELNLAAGGFVRREERLNGPGSQDSYPVVLSADQEVIFTPGRFNRCHNWQLLNDQGERVFGPASMCGRSVRFSPASSGVFQLVITATPDSADFGSDYAFAAGTPGIVTTRHDLRVDRALEAFDELPLPGAGRVFELEFLAEEVVKFQIGLGSEGCSGLVAARVLAPDGTLLFSLNEGDCGATRFLRLGRAGIYRVEFQLSPDAEPERYGLQVDRARQAPGRWVAQTDLKNPLQGPGTALLAAEGSSDVYVAGPFAGGVGVAQRSGEGWDILGLASRQDAVPVRVLALLRRGAHLFAAGNFTSMGGVAAPGIARWNGSIWESLGTGIEVVAADFSNQLLEVRDLAFLGDNLFAGGLFRVSGGVPTFNLSRWDGTRWHSLPGPLGLRQLDGVGGRRDDLGESADSLVVLGGKVYVAGAYQFPSSNIGGWGLDGMLDNTFGGTLRSTFDRGRVRLARADGGLLYVQGEIGRAGANFGTIDVQDFAVWTGTEWRRGPTSLPSFGVSDMVVRGETIVVGGMLFNLSDDTATGRPENSTVTQGIGLWNGTEWSAPGIGVESEAGSFEGAARVSGSVARLQLRGQQLYVTGQFTFAGGNPAAFYAVWENAP
ncbi:MAG: Ig-like domain-containing protein [Verrucomicrobiales bacterium]|nr:Ig-like domain-containing protein [Verrucomicrobiales bacterium]